ncbi:MAG: hypothetical protein EOM03_18345 [Clostridia bacterium]|nr:hypothetical protein [Clostridia bacterium]
MNLKPRISKIVIKNKESRKELIPIIIAHCRTEESWPVIVNGVFSTLFEFAPADPESREEFIDLYIYLARKNAYVTGESGFRNIWTCIEKGYVNTKYARLPEILELAEASKDSKNSDIRYYSVKILDWNEDSSQ